MYPPPPTKAEVIDRLLKGDAVEFVREDAEGTPTLDHVIARKRTLLG